MKRIAMAQIKPGTLVQLEERWPVWAVKTEVTINGEPVVCRLRDGVLIPIKQSMRLRVRADDLNAQEAIESLREHERVLDTIVDVGKRAYQLVHPSETLAKATT